MVNKNYKRGYDKETLCVKQLTEAGYWAERFYASKGVFDVIAVNTEHTRLIQVKRSKLPIKAVSSIATKYRDDVHAMMKIPHNMGVCIELWVWVDSHWLTSAHEEGSYRKAGWRKFDVYEDGIVETPEWVT